MSGADRPSSYSSFRLSIAVVLLIVSSVVAMSTASPAAAVANRYRIDLRVLVLDDGGSPWVDAIESQMTVEGVPFTTLPIATVDLTPALLSSGDEAFYQAVIAPSYELAGLSDAERATLRAFEAKFGVREVDGYNWANPAIGLNYAAVFGDVSIPNAAVTQAGLDDGFRYLRGPVPFSLGGYSWLAEPLPAASLPAGATFTTLVGAPLPNGATGSLLGVYADAGVEQLMITSALNFYLPQFKYVAHGIVSWATRGVHFGYNRNNLTFHVDDAFSSDSLWNSDLNCTPGEDCTGPEASARMTPDDVAYAVAWQQANDYQMTLAFNGFYADAAADPLTQALQANKAAFRWLNHGAEHIYQGCIQNFSVVPWQCTFDANGVVWTSQQTIYDEITNNIAIGNALGLDFDPTEYLSGEHSGLFFLPQQPSDNPNFAAALIQAGILHIASDASRDNVTRQVGSATTIPRHPTALYYNTSTQAQAVDEYNWLYNTRANGGSGYCEDNPATATCLPAPLGADGFTSYIVPTDAAFDMNFILGNDPRPFYAHVSNMTDDRLLYNLLDTILGTYRTVFSADTPLTNLSLTQASTALDRQTRWAATASVSGYVQNGQITISNPAGVAVPFTAPIGTVINGTTLEIYGGESSAWLTPGSTTGALPGAIQLSVTGNPAFVVGTGNTVNISATGVPTPTVAVDGDLPAGLTFTAGPGTGVISGIPVAGTGGSYPLTITADNGTTPQTQQLVIAVAQAAQFTSVNASTAITGTAFSHTIATTGYPAATITRTGTLPTGITFVAGTNGTATLSGTASSTMAGRTFPLTFTATNAAGVVIQAFTLTVAAPNSISMTVTGSTAFAVGRSNTINISTVAVPTATVSITGALPGGVTFSAAPGTGTIGGTPAAGTGGSYPITIRATSGAVVRTQALTITVAQAPAFTSAASADAAAGRSFSFDIATSGYPAATISRSGTLPPGVSFTAGANGTARLSGVPASSTAGRTYTLTFTARSSSGTATQTFTLTLGRAPTLSGSTFVFASSGRSFTYTLTAASSPTATITVSGALPKGLTFVDNHNNTARVSGTLAQGGRGLYTITFTAKNTYGTTTRALLLIVL